MSYDSEDLEEQAKKIAQLTQRAEKAEALVRALAVQLSGDAGGLATTYEAILDSGDAERIKSALSDAIADIRQLHGEKQKAEARVAALVSALRYASTHHEIHHPTCAVLRPWKDGDAIAAAEAHDRAVRNAALLEVASKTCLGCREGAPLNGAFHQRPRGVFDHCDAFEIRALASKEAKPCSACGGTGRASPHPRADACAACEGCGKEKP